MNTQKSTPGPWEAYRANSGEQYIRATDGTLIAERLYDEEREPELETLEANTLLISKAPELLEALRRITAHSSERNNDYDAVGAAEKLLSELEGV